MRSWPSAPPPRGDPGSPPPPPRRSSSCLCLMATAYWRRSLQGKGRMGEPGATGQFLCACPRSKATDAPHERGALALLEGHGHVGADTGVGPGDDGVCPTHTGRTSTAGVCVRNSQSKRQRGEGAASTPAVLATWQRCRYTRPGGGRVSRRRRRCQRGVPVGRRLQGCHNVSSPAPGEGPNREASSRGQAAGPGETRRVGSVCLTGVWPTRHWVRASTARGGVGRCCVLGVSHATHPRCVGTCSGWV